MAEFNVKQMLDPVRFAREEGRIAGKKEMRDKLRADFASFAYGHPNPVVSDELHAFVEWIEKADLS